MDSGADQTKSFPFLHLSHSPEARLFPLTSPCYRKMSHDASKQAQAGESSTGTATSGQSNGQRSTSASSSTLPASNLDRMDPDSILADEADPDTILGAETDSEAGEQQSRPSGSSGADSPSNTDAPEGTETPTMTESRPQGAAMTPTASTLEASKALQQQQQGTNQGFKDDPVLKSESESKSESASQELARLRSQVEDLTNQVTGLNGKLVNSFMRISDLEDDLSDARERVMSGSTRVAELEKERQEHLAALNTGLLVEKAHVSSEMSRMMDRVIEETKQRGQAENDKAKIEAELDELSASLFNEANRMVAVEKLARHRAEEKSKSMEERLQDTEGIMLEQQKVLADLQQKIDASKGSDGPAQGTRDANGDIVDTVIASSGDRATDTLAGGARDSTDPLSGTLVDPKRAVMLDVVPYQELRLFLDHLRKLRKQLAPFYTYPYDPARPNASYRHSGSAGVTVANQTNKDGSVGPSSPGLQSLPMAGPYASYSYHASANDDFYSVNASPFVQAGLSRHKDYPTLPSNCENLVHLPSQLSLPFIKRAQEEDSEPCLRLDFAPGLNWLTRRTANTAILEGNLVIEPVFSAGKVLDEDAVRLQYAHLAPAACAMCGIPVVNVPLPGGEEASARTGTPDLRTVTNWAQSMAAATGSAAFSLREAATSGNASSASTSPRTGGAAGSDPAETKPPPLKTRSSGLFSSLSSLRGKAGSPKPAQTASITTPETIQDAEATPKPSANAATQSPASTNAAPSYSIGPLPVPTHIFRLSETGTSRYLLCPHHCLVRLRAACAFWGYLRNIERAVVLEGKLAWDDEKEAVTAAEASQRGNATAPPVPSKSAANAATVKEASQALNSAVAVESTEAASGDGVDSVTETKDESKPEAISEPQESKSTDAADDDDDADAGFHDAASGSASPSGQGEPQADGSATNDQSSAAEADGGTKKPAPLDIDAANSTSLAEDLPKPAAVTPTTLPSTPTGEGPPPVPPRRARRAVPPTPSSSSAAAPTLPPRASGSTTPNVTAASVPTASTQRRSLPLSGAGDTAMTWEEKVYLEVIRLKQAMWEARAGFEHRAPVKKTGAVPDKVEAQSNEEKPEIVVTESGEREGGNEDEEAAGNVAGETQTEVTSTAEGETAVEGGETKQ